MRPRSPGFYIGIVATIILGFGVVAGVVFGLRAAQGLGYDPSVLQATKTGPNTAELDISTFPDSMVCHPDAPNPEIGWVTYCPTTTFELPPNSLITVVIKQYDSATGLYNNFFQTVQGTVGGTAMYNGKTNAATYNGLKGQVPADEIAHTFTIQSQPDETNPIYVSVPLIGVPDDAPSNVTINGNQYPTPNVISFQFHTGPAGHTYIWHCYVPCGNDRESPYGFSGPMSTSGYMAGSITVASY